MLRFYLELFRTYAYLGKVLKTHNDALLRHSVPPPPPALVFPQVQFIYTHTLSHTHASTHQYRQMLQDIHSVVST